MKKGFTLIEMLVVIIIIGILLGMSMWFSNDRIVDLKVQNSKERFVDAYTSLVSQRLISSYHNFDRYHSLTLAFASWIMVALDSGSQSPLLSDFTFQLTWMQVDHTPVPDLTVILFPYLLSCNFSTSGSIFSFGLMNPSHTYCFSLDAATCSLREYRCQDAL